VQIDKANELLILSQGLVHQDARRQILSVATPDDFLTPVAKQFYWLLGQIEKRGLKPSVNSYIAMLQRHPGGTIVREEEVEELVEIGQEKNPNLDEHLGSLKEDHVRWIISEQGVAKLAEAVERGSVPLEVVRGIVGDWSAKLDKVDTSVRSTGRHLGQIMPEYREYRELVTTGKGFFPTRFANLDEHLTEGLAPKKVTIVAGRPGMGKSTFVLNLAIRLSHAKTPVVIFSLEMNTTSLIDKLIAYDSKIDLSRLQHDDLTPKERRFVEVSMRRWTGNKYLIVDDTPMLTLEAMRSQITRLQRALGQTYMVVIVDLFGKVGDIQGENLANVYERKLNEVQLMARQLGVHFVLVAQISRKAESGKDPEKYRPGLSSIKNSGAFEEVADLVLFLFRPRYYQKDLPEDVLEVHIAKQRMGEQGIVASFEFDGAISSLNEVDRVAVAAVPDESGATDDEEEE